MKTCTKCKKNLSLKDFYQRNDYNRLTYRSHCKTCTRSSRKPQKGYHKYMNIEDYENLLVAQNNGCAICGKKEQITHKTTGMLNLLSVDHNHETNRVRGLLCRRCNSGLGHFDDNLETLMKAIEYLRKYA